MTRSSLRVTALCLAGMLVLPACSDDADGPTPGVTTTADVALPDGDGATSGTVDPTGPPTPEPGPASPQTEAPATPEPTTTPTGEPADPTTEPDAPAVTPASDAGAVGANGRAMLRGDRPTLVLEVDVQEGAAPSSEAMDHLVAVLSEIVDKPGGIVFRGGNTFADDRTEWSSDDLRAAVAANRSTATTDGEVSVHVLYVRGSNVRDGQETTAIGLAYSASTVALFPDRWSGLGSLLGSDRAVERAVLVHELGHLLGLVNLTYTSPIDHADPDHPGHSSNEDSVMFHAVESTLIGQVFSGSPPDRFDADDLADLRGLRDGSL